MANLGERARAALVGSAVVHSAAVGVALAFFPAWAAGIGGFEAPAPPAFFVRQGGIFHLVLAAAYSAEYRASGGLRLLLFAKVCATLFLAIATLAGGVPWSVRASGAGDALFALAAWGLWPRGPGRR